MEEEHSLGEEVAGSTPQVVGKLLVEATSRLLEGALDKHTSLKGLTQHSLQPEELGHSQARVDTSVVIGQQVGEVRH